MSLCRAAAALSSPPLECTAYETGRVCCRNSGSAIGAALSDSESPVRASLSLSSTTKSPGPASSISTFWAPSVRKKWATRSSVRVRGFTTVASFLSVPENTRT